MTAGLERTVSNLKTRLEDAVHAIAPDGHGHAVRGVGVLDGTPGGEAHGDGLPAAVEAEVAGGVDVYGEVGVSDEAVDLDVVAGLGGAEVDEVVPVLGIVALEAVAEAVDEVLADDGRQLLAGPLSVQGVCADQADVLLRDAGFRQLFEDGLDGEAADGAEGWSCGVVEGDEYAVAGTDELTDAGEADGVGEGLPNGGILVSDGRDAGSTVAAADNRSAVREGDLDRGVAVGEGQIRHGRPIIARADRRGRWRLMAGAGARPSDAGAWAADVEAVQELDAAEAELCAVVERAALALAHGLIADRNFAVSQGLDEKLSAAAGDESS
jgi:hypothetical protein